ncbi:MAG: hypothetical protein ACYC5Y_04930 [Symbiobacteriia bacterium]
MIANLLWSALRLIGAVVIIVVIPGVIAVIMWGALAVLILRIGAWLLLLVARGLLVAPVALRRLWRRDSTQNHNPN